LGFVLLLRLVSLKDEKKEKERERDIKKQKETEKEIPLFPLLFHFSFFTFPFALHKTKV
jgi:hypothetical protein